MKASSVEHLRLSSQEEGDEDSDRDRDDNSAQMQKMGLKNTTYTIKDNHDTIRSNQTTFNMMIEEMNKVRELPSIRYIFSFEPEEICIKQLRKQVEGCVILEEAMNTASNIWRVFLELYQKLKQIDEEVVLLTCFSDKEKGPKCFDDKDSIKHPKDTAEVITRCY